MQVNTPGFTMFHRKSRLYRSRVYLSETLMAEDTTTALIEKQEWLDTAADTLQKAVTSAYEAGGEAGQRIKDAMHGTWLGHPLHAAVTDVPIGAWTASVVMDAIDEMSPSSGMKTGADTALAIGLAGAGLAAVAGLTDWSATDGRARKIGLTHGLLNVAAVGLFTTSFFMRRADKRTEGRALSAIGFATSMLSAWLGGKLTYSEQIGADHTVGQHFPNEFTRVLADSELGEGQMRRVEVNGSRALLAKRDGHIYSIAEVCSHLGGPLAEGEFTGTEVRCPWHGSCFSLEDGSVIHGPATHPQPCLETRIQDGQIEIRSR